MADLVLIESDWNLKLDVPIKAENSRLVLIESDWNLKHQRIGGIQMATYSINRIRLEFKGRSAALPSRTAQVLIESDWNLK